MTQGICRNPGCPSAPNPTPVERYAGPGEYCPECGELLDAFDAPPQTESPKIAQPVTATATVAPPPAPAPAIAQPQAATATIAPPPAATATIAPPRPEAAKSSQPFGGLTALEALQQFAAEEPPPAPAPPRPPTFTFPRTIGFPRRGKPLGFAIGGMALAAIAAVFVVRPIAMGRAAPGNVVHVCRSAMTERFASDVVRAYADKAGLAASRFDLSSRTGCDVRFGAASVPAAGTVGYDGVVVIVNPQNPLSRLSNSDVRRIFRGEISDWSQLGQAAGPIEAVLPEDGTDEAQVLAQRLLLGSSVGANVRRVASGADIVRAVTAAGGRRAIGMVAFSAAVPAKVVTLDAAPAPSVISIGAQRYPLSVAVTVAPEGTSHLATVVGLVRFARSESAQTILSQDGFVPKKGF